MRPYRRPKYWRGKKNTWFSHKSSTDIVLYSQIYEIEGDYDKAATIILDYLKDNDSGTAVRMYDRLKHLKPHCSSDISEQITPYEN